MKRILIIGSSSFVGANLCTHLRKHHVVYGTYRTRAARIDGVTQFPLELMNMTSVETLYQRLKPDFIIYSAAIRDALCEKQPAEARHINISVPSQIAALTSRDGKGFLYFSSSKVFDGKAGQYTEEDLPSPKTAYGVSKRQAEEELAHFPGTFILRLGTLFGFGPDQNQFLRFPQIIHDLYEHKKFQFIADEWRSFCWVDEVARAVAKVIEADPDTADLYNWGGAEKDSYYSFVNTLCEAFGMSHDSVFPLEGKELNAGVGQHEARGADLSLDPTLFAKTFHIPPKTTLQMLSELRNTLHLGNQ